MSVEFSNAYQEILLENLVSIIKQNFMFQTQIKLLEKIGKDKEEFEKRYNELKVNYDKLLTDAKQVEIYKNKAEQNSSAHEEKNRIQTALNEEMKKTSSLKAQIDSISKEKEKVIVELNNLKDYLEKVKGFVPASKLKKIDLEEKPKAVFEEKDETPKIKNNLQKILDGSSF